MSTHSIAIPAQGGELSRVRFQSNCKCEAPTEHKKKKIQNMISRPQTDQQPCTITENKNCMKNKKKILCPSIKNS